MHASVPLGRRLWRWVRLGLVLMAALAPFAGQAALFTGQGVLPALGLAAVQVLAVGVLAGMAAPRLRGWAMALPGAMLLLLGLAALHSPAAGLRAAAGSVHAISYATLLLLFGATLRPGQLPMVTRFAQRMNPRFHAGMLGYTRGVTWAWCLLFGGELVASAALLAWAPGAWVGFTNFGHLLPVLALALGEYALRRRRFGAESTDFRTMLREAVKR